MRKGLKEVDIMFYYININIHRMRKGLDEVDLMCYDITIHLHRMRRASTRLASTPPTISAA